MKFLLNSKCVLCVISSMVASNSSIFMKYSSRSVFGAFTASCSVSAKVIKLADAYGFKTYTFNNNIELEKGIDEVLNTEGPVLCEIMMVENQLLIPRVQSSKDESGKIISNSLENMFPYLSKEEMKEIML